VSSPGSSIQIHDITDTTKETKECKGDRVRIDDEETKKIHTDIETPEKTTTTVQAADVILNPVFLEGGFQRMGKLLSKDKSNYSTPQEN
jgi:hypothetical protein